MSGHLHRTQAPPHITAKLDQDLTTGGRALDELIDFHRAHTDDSGLSKRVATECVIGRVLVEGLTFGQAILVASAVERLAAQ